MAQVTNKEQIQLRAGIQAQRDAMVTDIALFSKDLYDSIEKRRSLKKKEVTGFEIRTLQTIIQSLIDHHFYLKFEDKWVKADQQKKNQVYGDSSVFVLNKIMASKSPAVAEELMFTITSEIEAIYRKIFS